MRLKNVDRITFSLSDGPKTLKQIVQETGITTRTASNALKTLCVRGSVRKYGCLEDARAHCYVLILNNDR
jgi:DNA-binding MarR family transcriptional regulator